MRSFADPATRRDVIARLRRLQPDTPGRWGRMTAPEMVAHLSDQMGHTLGDHPTAPRPGPLRWPGVKYLAIRWLPWPRGRLQGPPEAFVSRPGEWRRDVDRLVALVERFAARPLAGKWPQHALFGEMSGEDWGRFCFKHFDHHLRQFGV